MRGDEHTLSSLAGGRKSKAADESPMRSRTTKQTWCIVFVRIIRQEHQPVHTKTRHHAKSEGTIRQKIRHQRQGMIRQKTRHDTQGIKDKPSYARLHTQGFIRKKHQVCPPACQVACMVWMLCALWGSFVLQCLVCMVGALWGSTTRHEKGEMKGSFDACAGNKGRMLKRQCLRATPATC